VGFYHLLSLVLGFIPVFSVEGIVVTVVEGIVGSSLEVLLFSIVGFCCTCCCCLRHPFCGLFLGKLSFSPY
jgi:hypothetical protein